MYVHVYKDSAAPAHGGAGQFVFIRRVGVYTVAPMFLYGFFVRRDYKGRRE